MEFEKSMRLQKFLAHSGLCSRRDAESLIEAGEVRVNGRSAPLGTKVDPSKDHVSVNGKRIRPLDENKKRPSLVLALNKPRGVLCSHSDPYHTHTIFDLLPRKYQKEKLICAGRLDKESEGLIILTNDGDLSHRITHPSFGMVKRYQVILNKEFNKDDIPQLLKGVIYEKEHLFANKVLPATSGPDAAKRLEVHLKQGRKREIRRLFEALGYRVHRLKRTQIGRFKLKHIARGDIHVLSQKEIQLLLG
tara:strand:+ start:4611 stop:5354 length:744 start_codon:yes stop_codon:yes gene_type:complete